MNYKLFISFILFSVLTLLSSCAHTEVLGRGNVIIPANSRKSTAGDGESEITVGWVYAAKTIPILYNAKRLFVYQDGVLAATVESTGTEKIVVKDGVHALRFVPARRKLFFTWVPAGRKADDPVIEATIVASRDNTIVNVGWQTINNNNNKALYFSQIRKDALSGLPLKTMALQSPVVPPVVSTPASPAASVPLSSSQSSSISDELERLIDMYSRGLLTEEQFNRAKERILQ